MKKLMTIAACAMMFASCGGGNDMEADSKTLCDCFADTEKNKPEDCLKKFEDMKKNYSKEESKELWTKSTAGCK